MRTDSKGHFLYFAASSGPKERTKAILGKYVAFLGL
jgi:hypothetical protein